MILPDARLASVRERVAASVASLDPQEEDDALRWIEAVVRVQSRLNALWDAANAGGAQDVRQQMDCGSGTGQTHNRTDWLPHRPHSGLSLGLAD